MIGRFITTLFFLFLTATMYCQGFQFGAGLDYNTQNMDELKVLMDETFDVVSNDFPLQRTRNYPASYGYSVTAGLTPKTNFTVGIIYTWNSTDSKIDYNDNLHEIEFQHNISANTLGLTGTWRLNVEEKHQINYYFGFEGHFIMTKLNIGSMLILDDTRDANEFDFKGRSIALKPYVLVSGRLFSNFFLELKGGYLFDTEGKVFVDGNKDLFLVDSGGNTIRSNWSGLRLGLGLSFKISTRNTE